MNGAEAVIVGDSKHELAAIPAAAAVEEVCRQGW